MRQRFNITAITVSALVIAGGLVSTPTPSFAVTTKHAPVGQVDSIVTTVGEAKVCKVIHVLDEDTPTDQLILKMMNNPDQEMVTLEGEDGRQLCVNPIKELAPTIVRYSLTDGEHTSLFENTIYVRPRPDAAPTGSIKPISVPISATPGEYCETPSLSDDDHPVDQLSVKLSTAVEGVSIKENKLCVDTTKPVAKKSVMLTVTDPAGEETPFETTIRVYAEPTISANPITAVVGEGENKQVCTPIAITDLDSESATLAITLLSGPESAHIDGRNLCISTATALETAEVVMKVEDPDKNFSTFKMSVVVKDRHSESTQELPSKPAVPGTPETEMSANNGVDPDNNSPAGDSKVQNDPAKDDMAVVDAAKAKDDKSHGQTSAPALAKTGFVDGSITSSALAVGALGFLAAAQRRRKS